MTSQMALTLESLTQQVLVLDAVVQTLLPPRWNTLDGFQPPSPTRVGAPAGQVIPLHLANVQILADHRLVPTEALLLPTAGASLSAGWRYLFVFIPSFIAGERAQTQHHLLVYCSARIDQDQLVLETPLLQLDDLASPVFLPGRRIPFGPVSAYLLRHQPQPPQRDPFQGTNRPNG